MSRDAGADDLMEQKRVSKVRRITACILACLLAALLFFTEPSDYSEAAVRDVFLSGFKQTVYNQENGLESTEVNCILQSRSGYLWVGTDGGLYRFNGKEFRIFNLWDTDKADIYFINDLFQDEEDRLWISTNNYGLFCMMGSEVRHFTSDYYEGIKSIHDVVAGPDGTVYVATGEGLFTVDTIEDKLIPVKDMQGVNVRKITIAGDLLWGIDSNNHFFLRNEAGQILSYSSEKYVQDELSCILGMEDGSIYLGTLGTEVLHIDRSLQHELLNSARDGINSLYYDGTQLFVCADSGIGYFNSDHKFYQLYDTAINRYISSMIMDYEGDYWFASNRMGLLFLGRSKFRNFNERYGIAEAGTNCIRAFGVKTYIGTDDGLMILDSSFKPEKSELTEYLSGASVKDVMRDSRGNIWVSTSRRYGLVRCTPSGEIQTFGRTGPLQTNQVNCTLQLSDGTIAVATEDGIRILGQDEELIRSYSQKDGLEYPNINCMYEAADGRLFAGSDGGGIYLIEYKHEGRQIRNYTEEDGLTSNVVTCIVPGTEGLWIGTDNGLSLFTESVRAISNIDFSNNIYDIQTDHTDDGDTMWIVGSKGVLRTTESELLSTDGISGRYYAQGDGLARSLTLYSHNAIRDHVLYLSCDSGIYMIPTDFVPENATAPKLTVSEINVDDTVYHFDQIGGSLKIPSGTQRVSISFAVLSYTNRENIQVEYMLQGFDGSPITITPADPMQAVYTNLEGGTYTFTVRAVNGDGFSSKQDITFTIEKEFGFFEMTWVKITVLALLVLLVLIVAMGLIWFQRRVTGQNLEIEKLEKEHEVAVKSSTAKTDFLAHMSNEIKTPINAIISLAENLQHEDSQEVRQQNLKAIVDSGQDILGKVDETIQLARLEAGKVTVTETPYSITTLVCDISDGLINTLTDRPVRFLVDLGENIPDIMVGDYDKIKRILEILTDNAQKYTKEGTITLFVDCYQSMTPKEKDTLLFSISDTGIGIRKERLQHIFEVYNIADNKKQSGYSGSGINLAIAKKLAEIQGGELEVESTYGAGSTFTVSLKQSRPSKDGVPLAVGPENLDRVTREEAEKMLLSDVNMLLVDDIEISRAVAVGVLKQLEVRTDVATSGVSAVDMVTNGDYDMVFMDLSMPVMSGEDALKEIRELEKDGIRDLPIIAMTEDAIREDHDRLLEAGFSDVIVKPLDLVSLAAAAKKFLPPEKIHFRSVDLSSYMNESRFREGLEGLQVFLDVTGTLERIGGSIEVYNRILSTFYDQNRNAADELQGKFSKNYRAFRGRLHSVRTGAQNIGATELVNLISRVDAAINIGNKGYVRDNLPSLVRMLEDILNAVSEYLDFAVNQQGRTDDSGNVSKMGSTDILNGGSKSDPEGSAGNETILESDPSREELHLSGTEGSDGNTEKEPVQKDRVEEASLNRIAACANASDVQGIAKELEKLAEHVYGTEDTEFLQAMADQAREADMDAILEMIDTYRALKKN